MQSPIVIALDYPTSEQAIKFAKTLDSSVVRLKIGKELFVSSGANIVYDLQNLGFDIFLDLKFHDIPNTVAKACTEVAKLGVWMTNIHAMGGSKMMQQVVSELSVLKYKPIITAVTILTSMDSKQLTEIGVKNTSVQQQVLRLAKLSKENGIDGVVCSAQEAKLIRDCIGKDFVIITPGIRLESDASNDQSRIMTAKEAIINGSNYLVIGRPITQSDNPQLKIEKILKSIS